MDACFIGGGNLRANWIVEGSEGSEERSGRAVVAIFVGGRYRVERPRGGGGGEHEEGSVHGERGHRGGTGDYFGVHFEKTQ